jgi:ppGpp synthetase/RelA/SpoT-type nucleotidyltranferase
MTIYIRTEIIERAVKQYHQQRDRYVKLTDRIEDVCRSLIVTHKIMAQVSSRTKTVIGFQEKLHRFSNEPKKRMGSVNKIFETVGDLSGVRISTYRPEDEPVVALLLKEMLIDLHIDKKDKNLKDSNNFYRATHVQAKLPKNWAATHPGDENILDLSCEIQICSMMAHVWNEIEHDIVYKNMGLKATDEERSYLSALGHLTRSGDKIIGGLVLKVLERERKDTENFKTINGFGMRIRDELEEIAFSKKSLETLFNLNQIFKLDYSDFKSNFIMPLKGEPKTLKKEIEEFNNFLSADDNSGQLSINLDNSDLMLMLMIKQYYEKLCKLPAGRGLGKPTRPRRIATRYKEFIAD